jgi:homoserine kinase
MLPGSYSREDTVANIQATALLVSAFALHRGDLLDAAMRDRVHQPYRLQACPLLGLLLPLSGTPGILSAALSGAGPSVLLVVEDSTAVPAAISAIREAAQDPKIEVLHTRIAAGAESR